MKTPRRDPIEQLISMLAGLGLHRGIVLAITPGGVRLADRVARGLDAPLDMVPARKVVVGDAIGSVAVGGIRIVASDAIAALGLHDDEVERHLDTAAAALDSDDRFIRGGAPMPDLTGRTAVLVDDGAITGLTMAAAAAAVRDRAVAHLVAVVPFCSEQATARITGGVNRLIAIEKVSQPDAIHHQSRIAAAIGEPPAPDEIHDLLTRRLRDLGLGSGNARA